MATLRDYIRIKHGYAFKGQNISTIDNNVVLVTPVNFAIGGGFKEDKCKYFDAEYPDDYVLKADDLIVTMTDLSKTIDTLGYSALVPDGKSKRVYLHNQRIGLVTINSDELNKHYIYWFMRSSYYQKMIAATSTGSTVHHTSPDRILDIEIELPKLENQNKIAAFLDNIESLIQLNVEINNNLEQQAVVLFRSWFSAFSLSPNSPRINSEFGEIPEDFTVVKVGSLPMLVTDYVANGSFASLKANVNLYQEPNYAYFIRNTDLKSGSFGVFVDQHSYEFLSKSTLYGGDIIISNVGDVGSVFLCPKLDGRMTLGNNIIMLRPEDDHLRYYLYIWFKYLQGQALIQGIKGGSAQPKFNKTDFKNTSVLVPPKDILTRFHETVAPMFETISQRQTETFRLADLRDTLLPQLMSGEIDVSNLDL